MRFKQCCMLVMNPTTTTPRYWEEQLKSILNISIISCVAAPSYPATVPH